MGESSVRATARPAPSESPLVVEDVGATGVDSSPQVWHACTIREIVEDVALSRTSAAGTPAALPAAASSDALERLAFPGERRIVRDRAHRRGSGPAGPAGPAGAPGSRVEP